MPGELFSANFLRLKSGQSIYIFAIDGHYDQQ